MFCSEIVDLKLSGERFSVIYKIWGSKEKAYEAAKVICLEQTVEFPGDLVPDGPIRDCIVGRIESFEPWTEGCFKAVISYAVESAAGELTQLINVIFGNTSLKPGIRVEGLDLPEAILKDYKGPRFGRNGLREWLGVHGRPLLFTAIKPMGLSAKDLADLAYKLALGGIDIIKDDHGLSNQAFSPYEERVKLCTEAVTRANKETGYNCSYVPNITAPHSEVKARAKFAKEAGAGGLLICPGLTGLDVMRELAEDDEIALPIFSHPAFQGSYVLGGSGISHAALFGQINRIAGADAAIYPNFGGRFSFSREECQSIAEGTKMPMGHVKPIFPSPAGGMNLASVPESMKIYGNNVIFLIGGGLFQYGPDLIENCRHFRELVEKFNS